MLAASLLRVTYTGPRATTFQRENGLYLTMESYEVKSQAEMTRVELGETVLSGKIYPEDCTLWD